MSKLAIEAARTEEEKLLRLYFAPIFGEDHIQQICDKHRKRWNGMSKTEREHYIQLGMKIIEGL